MPLFWMLTLLGCLIGGWILSGAVLSSQGAAQQAAAAAISVAFGVLPYCFARALSELLVALRK
jgi:hypothetical protein